MPYRRRRRHPTPEEAREARRRAKNARKRDQRSKERSKVLYARKTAFLEEYIALCKKHRCQIEGTYSDHVIAVDEWRGHGSERDRKMGDYFRDLRFDTERIAQIYLKD